MGFLHLGDIIKKLNSKQNLVETHKPSSLSSYTSKLFADWRSDSRVLNPSRTQKPRNSPFSPDSFATPLCLQLVAGEDSTSVDTMKISHQVTLGAEPCRRCCKILCDKRITQRLFVLLSRPQLSNKWQFNRTEFIRYLWKIKNLFD